MLDYLKRLGAELVKYFRGASDFRPTNHAKHFHFVNSLLELETAPDLFRLGGAKGEGGGGAFEIEHLKGCKCEKQHEFFTQYFSRWGRIEMCRV